MTGIIDEIKLGPVRLELRDTAVEDEVCIVVHTESSGKHSMGVSTTEEEWTALRRHVGMEGMI